VVSGPGVSSSGSPVSETAGLIVIGRMINSPSISV
jgi:hypothetical protein